MIWLTHQIQSPENDRCRAQWRYLVPFDFIVCVCVFVQSTFSISIAKYPSPRLPRKVVWWKANKIMKLFQNYSQLAKALQGAATFPLATAMAAAMAVFDWWLLAFESKFGPLCNFNNVYRNSASVRVYVRCVRYTLSMWFGMNKHFKYSIWERPYALHTLLSTLHTIEWCNQNGSQFELEWNGISRQITSHLQLNWNL